MDFEISLTDCFQKTFSSWRTICMVCEIRKYGPPDPLAQQGGSPDEQSRSRPLLRTSTIMTTILSALLVSDAFGLAMTESSGGSTAHDNIQPSLGINFLIQTAGNFEDGIGDIMMFGGNFAPRGYARCPPRRAKRGRVVPGSAQAALFSRRAQSARGETK